MTDATPTFLVNFNELLEPDLVLLSKGDERQDSNGRVWTLQEGMAVRVWAEDLGDDGQRDDLVADGVVERNRASGWSQHVKWCCRIGPAGIRHQSDKAASEERRHNEPADVQAVFRAGLSGYWPEPFLTLEQLLELAELCVERQRVICNVEAWLIANEAEIARTDLSFWEAEADSTLPWPERARKSRDEMRAIAAQARQAGGKVMFQVWLDWNNDGEPTGDERS